MLGCFPKDTFVRGQCRLSQRILSPGSPCLPPCPPAVTTTVTDERAHSPQHPHRADAGDRASLILGTLDFGSLFFYSKPS